MGNPLYYLFALMITFVYPLGIEPLFALKPESQYIHIPLIGTLSVTFAYILLSVLLYSMFMTVYKTCWNRFPRIHYRHYQILTLFRLLSLSLYLIAIFIFHFPQIIHEMMGGNIPVLTSLITISPLFVYNMIGSIALSHMQKTPSNFIRLVQNNAFKMQGFATFIFAPLVIIIGFHEFLLSSTFLNKLIMIYPIMGWVISVLFLSLFMMIIPIIIKMVLGATSLPQGSLRLRVMDICQRSGVSCRDVLIWNTRGSMMGNAFVSGLWGPLRYIFFTDYLLEHMSDSEIDAILGHELGHAKKKHMLFYLIFSISYMTILTVLSDHLFTSINNIAIVSLIWLVVALVFWLVLFTYASRRFESEADFYGAELVGSRALMASALMNVATVNNMPQHIKSMFHFSIQKRVAFLVSSLHDSSVENQLHNRVRQIKSALIILCLLAVIIQASSFISQMPKTSERKKLWNAYVMLDHAERDFGNKEYEKVEDELNRIEPFLYDNPFYITLRADTKLHLGKYDEARLLYLASKQTNTSPTELIRITNNIRLIEELQQTY